MVEDRPSDATAPSELRELLAKIDAHPGTQARREWDALTYVHAALIGNEHELLAMIDAIENNVDNMGITMAGNVPPDEPRRALYADLFRRLHNFVASAVTLIDHSRNLMANYMGTPTRTEYDDR